MKNLTSLTSKQLNRAVMLKDKITALEQELAAILGGAASATSPAQPPTSRKKSNMSADGRARIAAAQRARWAKTKDAKSAGVAAKPAAKKRVVSAAVKARLSAIAKKRWAKAKKAGKSAL